MNSPVYRHDLTHVATRRPHVGEDRGYAAFPAAGNRMPGCINDAVGAV